MSESNGAPVLKPCPFCGGEGEIRLAMLSVDERNDCFVEEYKAVCRQCAATTGQRYLSRFIRADGEFHFERDGYAEAIAGWNRRAEAAEGPPPEENET